MLFETFPESIKTETVEANTGFTIFGIILICNALSFIIGKIYNASIIPIIIKKTVILCLNIVENNIDIETKIVENKIEKT